MSIETIGANTAASRGTDLAVGAANTKGDWVELVASTAANADGILISLHWATSATDYLVDIGTGGAGSEAVIIADLVSHNQNDDAAPIYYIPLPIAAGTRISARAQNASGSGAISCLAHLISTTVKLEEVSSVATYGTNTADSGGTSIDPGATINTKGSWVEITSSLSADVKFIIPMIGNIGNAARTSATFLVDIGTGAESSESVVVPNLFAMERTTSDIMIPAEMPPIPIEIPSGTRVAVRAQCSINDATDRLFDFAMITANGAVVPATQNVVIPHTTRIM